MKEIVDTYGRDMISDNPSSFEKNWRYDAVTHLPFMFLAIGGLALFMWRRMKKVYFQKEIKSIMEKPAKVESETVDKDELYRKLGIDWKSNKSN